MMKRAIILALALCLPVALMAQQFMVKSMNSNAIKVGGKVAKINDVFSVSAPIMWPSDSAYMVVYALDPTPQRYTLTALYMHRHNVRTCRQFINTSSLYTRGVGMQRPSDTIYLADTAFVPRAKGGALGATAELRWGSHSIPLSLSADGTSYVIVRSMFGNMGGMVTADIWEHERAHRAACCRYRDLRLVLLPATAE
ncbi:MAG: hypothetical protein J6X79_04915 [Bacteroidales bacterium]|nr:hypothetical protein [Bacteroidales bacterium]